MPPIINPPALGLGSSVSPALPPPPPPAEKTSGSLIDLDDFSDYASAKLRIDRLISDFSPQIDKCRQNREQRFKDLDIKMLREKGILKEHQYMIPIRTIDANIRREQPSFINYLRQSRRLVIFKDTADAEFIPNKIEEEFSRGMNYSGWEVPHFKAIDGSQTHGWDAVEVVFDVTKPFHVALEHIGNDRLIFPLDAIDIQACELIARCYSVTARQLKQFVLKFGFDETEITTLIDKNNQTKKENSVSIYKCYWKKDNVVYVAWYHNTATTWLKMPETLYLGRKQMVMVPTPTPMPDPLNPGQIFTQMVNVETWEDIPEDTYPIFILPYYETEQNRIFDHKGRVFLDKHKQEALTANISQFLNGCQLASSIFVSLKSEALRQSEIQNIKIKEGVVSPIPLEYHSPMYPDAVMLKLQQYLDVYNSQEVGQLNAAVQNRQDSRKTATEISAAQQENSSLSSVQVTLYSTFIREVYTFVWQITQSQALQDKITFLFDEEVGTNDKVTIQKSFDLKAAGDVDVIKRQELIQQYQVFWPVIMNTPAATAFLARMLKLAFPDEGDRYATLIEQGDPRAIIMALVQIIDSVVKPEELAGLPSPQRETLIATLETAKNIAEGFMKEQNLAPEEQNPNQGADGQPSNEGENNATAGPIQSGSPGPRAAGGNQAANPS